VSYRAYTVARAKRHSGSLACRVYERGVRIDRHLACTAIEVDSRFISTAISIAPGRNFVQVIQFEQFGAPSQLHIAHLPRSRADAETAVVRLEAASVNPSHFKNAALNKAGGDGDE
jgi:hypothetical protein